MDYLLDPFSDERFDAALSHAIASVRLGSCGEHQAQIASVIEEHDATELRSGQVTRLVIRLNDRVALLPADDIDWLSAAGVYIEIHAASATHLYRSSLAGLLARLDPRKFLRVHRSVAVNTSRIVEFRPRGHGDFRVVLRDTAAR